MLKDFKFFCGKKMISRSDFCGEKIFRRLSGGNAVNIHRQDDFRRRYAAVKIISLAAVV